MAALTVLGVPRVKVLSAVRLPPPVRPLPATSVRELGVAFTIRESFPAAAVDAVVPRKLGTSSACECVVLNTVFPVTALTELGVPRVNVRSAARFPPPVSPLPAVSVLEVWTAFTIRVSLPAATVPAVDPTFRTAAPPRPRFVLADDALTRSDRLRDDRRKYVSGCVAVDVIPKLLRAVVALARSDRLLEVRRKAVAASTAIVPRPRFVRAVAALANEARLSDFLRNVLEARSGVIAVVLSAPVSVWMALASRTSPRVDSVACTISVDSWSSLIACVPSVAGATENTLVALPVTIA
ncbi:hypothetical protein D3C84_610510 [compost metagenome]